MPAIRLIYCADPLHPTQIDPIYAPECAAATHAGLDYALISYEALVQEQQAKRAVRRVAPAVEPTLAIYRGWMLCPADYRRLYAALAERNLHLINSPEAYRFCHYLPECYTAIADHTPRTVLLPLVESREPDFNAIMLALQVFGAAPVVLKDYVKSRKHEWAEACFIPSTSDRQAVERVVRRFIELQGEDLNEGLVFREYVAFEPLGAHSRSGMPLTREYRCFILDGAMLTRTAYWEEGDYDDAELPPETLFAGNIQRVRSRFFTLDVARRRDDGAWMIVEPGDGQVAGLPERLDPSDFYKALVSRLTGAQ